jgi:hypothetical protein
MTEAKWLRQRTTLRFIGSVHSARQVRLHESCISRQSVVVLSDLADAGICTRRIDTLKPMLNNLSKDCKRPARTPPPHVTARRNNTKSSAQPGIPGSENARGSQAVSQMCSGVSIHDEHATGSTQALLYCDKNTSSAIGRMAAVRLASDVSPSTGCIFTAALPLTLWRG